MKHIVWVMILCCISLCACKDDDTLPVLTETEKLELDTATFAAKAAEALVYVQKKKMNTHKCILINMRVHSGLPRWVEWDFKQKRIVSATQVTHGCGTAAWSGDATKSEPVFSNTPDSHLSSLGRYKIGERGPSQWGIGVKYLLHGMDTSNNNALKRYIVLHSWDKVSDMPTYPNGAPESWGCPAVSNDYMSYIDKVLKAEKTPVLLWIYY